MVTNKIEYQKSPYLEYSVKIIWMKFENTSPKKKYVMLKKKSNLEELNKILSTKKLGAFICFMRKNAQRENPFLVAITVPSIAS